MQKHLHTAILVIGSALAALAQGTSSFPAYVAKENLQGTLRLKGSDSIDPLVRLWIQEFQKVQPDVQFTVESHGSATAPAALLKQESEIGHMSRAMNETELGAFQTRFGHAPIGVTVAYDALAIYVNRKNPIKRLSVQQLDAIYGSTRLTGAEKSLDGWWQFPLQKHLVQRYWVRPYGRDENSGSRAFFMEKILQKGGKLKDGVRIKDQMGIMEVIGRDINAIGYGPESYRNPMVRMVPLVGLKSEQAYLPTMENIQSGKYALARTLYLYTNRETDKPLPPAVQAFFEFVLSGKGQDLAKGYGSAPLTPEIAKTELAKVL